MYLSRVAIDFTKHESRRALYNLEKMHGMVESSFLGERQRNLWRVDRIEEENYLLLLSPKPPQKNSLPEQIGYDNSVWETKSYEGIVSRIHEGMKCHFRLTANPTVAMHEKDNKRGKVKAITIVAKQREWMKKQAEKGGFLIQDNQFDVVESEWRTLKKANKEVHILAVTFEGMLTITNRESFLNALTGGIGREKAYGMGLLTVIPYD